MTNRRMWPELMPKPCFQGRNIQAVAKQEIDCHKEYGPQVRPVCDESYPIVPIKLAKPQAVVLIIVPTVPEVAFGAGVAATLVPSLSPSLSEPPVLTCCGATATGGVYAAFVELPIADVIFFSKIIARVHSSLRQFFKKLDHEHQVATLFFSRSETPPLTAGAKELRKYCFPPYLVGAYAKLTHDAEIG